MDASTIRRGSSSVSRSRAVAAAWAATPPEPMATTFSSGSMTSPLPEISSIVLWSVAIINASRRRRYLSARQSRANSTAERVRLPLKRSSFCSSFSVSVRASAVAPAKPTTIVSL